MKLAVVGVNYENTPIEVRDRVSFTDTKKMDMYAELAKIDINEVVILSTCNRSEVYFLYSQEEKPRQVMHIFEKLFDFFEIEIYAFVKNGDEALQYLFELAGGLQSLVIGEDQILGQVREAMEFSQMNGALGKIMAKIFRDAVTCAKKIKTEYRISTHPLSLSYIGILQLKKHVDFKGKKVLVLGSGKMAQLAIQYVHELDVACIYNCNRSIEHARELQQEFPMLQAVPFAERYNMMKCADVVICATTSPHPIVKAERLEAYKRPLYILDLAMPRDVESTVGSLEGITLFDIDGLKEIAEENYQKRIDKVEEIRGFIRDEMENTKRWLVATKVDPTIQSLQERIQNITEDTYAILKNKLDLTEREKHILKKSLQAALYRLIREPIATLKNAEAEKIQEYNEAVIELFHMNEEE